MGEEFLGLSEADEETLGAIIADVVERQRQGEKPKPEDYFDYYPHLREAIQNHFQTIDFLDGWLMPVKDPARESLGEALSKLPEPMQRVLFLRNFENRRWEEISRIIGKPPDEIRREYSKALNDLLELFSADKPTP